MPQTYSETHRSNLNAARVSFEDGALDRALAKLKTHPEVQAAGVFDEPGVLRAALELDVTELSDLPRAWRHWHDQTLSPEAIAEAIGKPWVFKGVAAPDSDPRMGEDPDIKGVAAPDSDPRMGEDPDIADTEDYVRELNRRHAQYRLEIPVTPMDTWDDVDEAATASVRSARAATLSPDSATDLDLRDVSWFDVEESVSEGLAGERDE